MSYSMDEDMAKRLNDYNEKITHTTPEERAASFREKLRREEYQRDKRREIVRPESHTEAIIAQIDLLSQMAEDNGVAIDEKAQKSIMRRARRQVALAVEADRGKKIGRNEMCPCGSGKKYKKCCGEIL